ncbi:creatininase family protein [Hymenobacter properus]|uniref:Creatininase family protein n=1 Tax=Hymenobacter properus TaxID=2791026 RepID=A0A931BNI2_9BACT|nr:creatininase family protein [Hymenobacter properus]MBF9142675.1 creatininase family protein [Hymenobacter properus]MBR7721483.1 creatininase family protein [Microvirga sp. SRT04]
MPPRPYILAEATWKTVQANAYQVVVLPWGATEAHNYHLPYATDNIQSDYVAAEAARKAWEQGAKVVVLPCIPFGVNTGQLDITLDINMSPSTQLALLRDVVQVLARQGIPKLVILNGHGGNDFRQILRELQAEFPTVFLSTLNWFKAADRNQYFSAPGDHADELETSAMLHIVPDLVSPLSEAGDGAAKQFRIAALRQGWAWAQREWSQVSADTGVGNPAAATAEKGQAFLEACTTNIAQFLVELAAADPRDLYE